MVSSKQQVEPALVLSLFGEGLDTAAIAHRLGIAEALAERALHIGQRNRGLKSQENNPPPSP